MPIIIGHQMLLGGGIKCIPVSALIANATPSAIEITFSSNVTGGSSDDFSVTGRTITNMSALGKVVTLTVSSPYFYGDIVTVDYTAPLVDPIKNAESFTDFAITNNCAVPAEYTTVYNSFTTKPSGALVNSIPNCSLTTINETQARMVDRLVKGGILAKRDIFYMFAQTTNGASEALRNWKNPGTFDATLVSTPTFNDLQGFTTASGKYLRTNYNPTTAGGNFTLISNNTAIGIATAVTEDARDFGYWLTAATNGVVLNSGVSGANALANNYYGSNFSIPKTNSIAHWYINRNGNTLEGYRNKIKTSSSNPPIDFYSGEIYIGCAQRVGIGANAPTTKQYRWFAAGGKLTQAEINEEVNAVEQYLYSIGANLMIYAPENDLVLTSNGEQTITFDLDVFDASAPVVIDWGDGTNQGAYFGDIVQERQHTYASAVPYTITISHANSIKWLRFGYDHVSNLEGDIARLNCCGALETLWFGTHENQWTGNGSGITKTLKVFAYYPIGSITFDITGYDDLESIIADSGLIGNMATNTKLVDLTLGSDASLAVICDISNKPDFEKIDSYADNSWCGGDVGLTPKLRHICHGSPNEYYGNLGLCPDFEYLDNYGDSHMTGDLTLLTKIYRFNSYNCDNAFTGDISTHILTQEFYVDDASTITKLSSIGNKPSLNYLNVYNWVYTEAEVNQILADKWADRNASYGAGTARGLILNTAGSAAPTGQGITDKAALQAYRSPTPPGTAALWTIETN